jgi:undecaprenyl-diphosphatase
VVNVLIASIPAMSLALLFGKYIKQFLFSPAPVAMAFIGGALIIFWAESRQTQIANPSSSVDRTAKSGRRVIASVDDLRPLDALKVGLAQCAALMPGTSRSGATIIGGMLFGLPRAVATEFSFFLAIPVIGGATAYELVKLWLNPIQASGAEAMHFGWAIAVGFVAAFISAFICVRWLIQYVASHTFVPFAWYRIVFGVVVLITAYTGLVAWS